MAREHGFQKAIFAKLQLKTACMVTVDKFIKISGCTVIHVHCMHVASADLIIYIVELVIMSRTPTIFLDPGGGGDLLDPRMHCYALVAFE